MYRRVVNRFGQPPLRLSLASIAFLKSVTSPSDTWLPYPALDDARCAEVDEHTVAKLDMNSTIKPRFLIRFWCNIAPLAGHENALCRDKAFHSPDLALLGSNAKSKSKVNTAATVKR